MKIICDACGAKYSIADEKVQGKVFKIRCKKCSNVIMVRGDTAGAGAAFDESDATRVYDDGGGGQGTTVSAPPAGMDQVWYVVVNQEQVGPLSEGDVISKLESGQIDGQTFAWKEGMTDWTALEGIGEFGKVISRLGKPAPVSASDAASSAVDDVFTAGTVDRAQAGASEPAAAQAQPAASSPQPTAEQQAQASSLFASQPAAQSSDEKLTGERNESSVLFSLNNLAKLASDKQPATQASSSASQPGMAQSGGQEGSGLIDIQSMAQVYLGDNRGGGAGASGSTPSGSADDIPVFSQTSFDQPAAVMLPTSIPSSSSNNKMLYMLIVILGMLAVVGVVIVVMLMGDDKKAVADNSQGQSTSAKTSMAAAASAESKSSEATTSASEKSSESSESSEKADSSESEKSSKRSSSKSRKSSRSSKRSSRSSSRRSSKSGSCDEVSCILDSSPSCCAKYRKGSSGGTTANLPKTLSSSDIKSAMRSVRGRVAACGRKHSGSGKVSIRMKVSPSGSVSGASVKTAPNKALGSCVASAAKRARFKKTQKGRSFTYPFLL